MKKRLIDSGPLIALFDKDDKYHDLIKTFLKSYEGVLYASWAVITEVLHMLNFNVEVQIDFADATLIIISELKNIDKIISIDSDFYIYRDIRNKYLKNVFNY